MKISKVTDYAALNYLIVSASWYVSFYASGEQVLIDFTGEITC